MKATKSWSISEEFWEQAKPLIPRPRREMMHKYLRRLGGGRKPMAPRKVLEAIAYILRTGCQRRALPKAQFGSASSVHKYFLEWKKKGVFVKLWRKGLAEYDEMEGIAWTWQSIDGAMVKAPMALETVCPNPTDRGPKWDEAKRSRRLTWNPSLPSRERGPKA